MKKIPFFLLLIVLFSSCDEQDKNFDYGSINGNVYSNDYFDFEFTYPQDWAVRRHDWKMEDDISEGDSTSEKSENSYPTVKVSQIETVKLFRINKHKIQSQVGFNPSIHIVAENLHGAEGVTGEDFLLKVQEYQGSEVEHKFGKKIFEKKIDKKVFYIMELKTNYLGVEANQDMVVTILNGFAFGFILTYISEREGDELYSILKGVKFN